MLIYILSSQAFLGNWTLDPACFTVWARGKFNYQHVWKLYKNIWNTVGIYATEKATTFSENKKNGTVLLFKVGNKIEL